MNTKQETQTENENDDAPQAPLAPHVLLIEDSPTQAMKTKLFLEREGFDVRTSGTGEEGLSEIRKKSPDLILCDSVLPGITGPEICKTLKQDPELQYIPILMLTIRDDKTDVVAGLDAGADDYVSKAESPEVLLARIRTHLRIKRLQDELRRLNELKDEFLGMASHDLKNPLHVIHSLAEALMMGVEGEVPDEQKTYLERICRQAGTMLNIINDLLDVSAIESGHIQVRAKKQPLEPILRESFDSYHLPAQRKKIRLEWDVPEKLGDAVFDETRLLEVLQNLLSNALKFTKPEGSVTLHAAPINGNVEIAVKDTGLGIPEKEVPRIFEKFAKLTPRPTGGESGTGLGLSICKQIVERMSGTIRVESEEGKGTSFVFTLPRS